MNKLRYLIIILVTLIFSCNGANADNRKENKEEKKAEENNFNVHKDMQIKETDYSNTLIWNIPDKELRMKYLSEALKCEIIDYNGIYITRGQEEIKKYVDRKENINYSYVLELKDRTFKLQYWDSEKMYEGSIVKTGINNYKMIFPNGNERLIKFRPGGNLTPSTISTGKVPADGIIYKDKIDNIKVNNRGYSGVSIGKHPDYQKLSFEEAVARLKKLTLEDLKYQNDVDSDYMEP